MISYVLVGTAALFISGLTMFSGFGLGTLLMPVFALFFSIETAVAATAVVHGANNIFKIFAVGRHADRSLVLRFGIPAILSAFAGASMLVYLSNFPELFQYSIGSKTAVITPIKLIMGLLMAVFALIELLPQLRAITFHQRYLYLGGVLSGFFGGLSGHQGALRSAFLAKVGISTQAFVGTNAAIGFMVDMTRIAAYGFIFLAGDNSRLIEPKLWPLIITGIIAAFFGVQAGKRFLHKVTMNTVQTLTGVLLLLIALMLGAGLI
jgi:uncharacterized membrane protein YfcA